MMSIHSIFRSNEIQLQFRTQYTNSSETKQKQKKNILPIERINRIELCNAIKCNFLTPYLFPSL